MLPCGCWGTCDSRNSTNSLMVSFYSMSRNAVSSRMLGGRVILGSFLMKLRIMLTLTTLLPVFCSSPHFTLADRAGLSPP
jgi:hypothetical protein